MFQVFLPRIHEFLYLLPLIAQIKKIFSQYCHFDEGEIFASSSTKIVLFKCKSFDFAQEDKLYGYNLLENKIALISIK